MKMPSTSERKLEDPRQTDVLLVIEWANTIEHVPLSLAALSNSSEIQTVERSNDLMWDATYDVRCTDVERNPEGWLISLMYDRSHLGNRALARAQPDLEWGVTRLTVAANLSEASAVFSPKDGSDVVPRKISIFGLSLYQQLTRAQVGVLLRPGQAALRKRLLESDDKNRCAVSNESCPDALEVAHIVDHGYGGVAGEHNAMLLRADLHNLLDSGLLTIHTNGDIKLGEMLPGSRYTEEAASWNRRLPESVLKSVRPALRERERLNG